MTNSSNPNSSNPNSSNPNLSNPNSSNSNSSNMLNSSNILQLESLTKEIQLTETKYEEAYKNYLSLLNTSDIANKYVQLNGRTYWGIKGLSQAVSSNVNTCEALCSSNKLCTGATYNSDSKTCYVRGGKGTLMVGTETTFAIITQMQHATLTLSELNAKLISLNQQMNTLIGEIKPKYKKENTKNAQAKTELDENYNKLIKEQKEIHKLLQNYQSINTDYNDTTLKVNQNVVIYNFLWVLIIIIIFVSVLLIFNITPNLALLFLIMSFLFYIFGMLTISAGIFFLTVLYVIVRF